jgi:hypothetical protein
VYKRCHLCQLDAPLVHVQSAYAAVAGQTLAELASKVGITFALNATVKARGALNACLINAFLAVKNFLFWMPQSISSLFT